MLVLVARIIFSWLPPRHQASELYLFLYKVTEPAMRPFRRLIPPIGGMDLSPILLFIILAVVIRLLEGL